MKWDVSLKSWLSRLVSCLALAGGIETALGGEEKETRAAAKPSQADYPKGFIVEGPLPDGFPVPSEAGKIVEKSYPLCRTFSAQGNRAFSKCFVYLVLHKHEMTAPVIMDYKHRESEKKSRSRNDLDFLDVQRMHFVLGNPTLDKPKQEGFVQVADLPRLRVLSLARQGELSPDELKRCEERLNAELARRGDVIATGPPRILGYNSPMVPKDRSYWEVQIPIEAKQPKGTESPKS